VVGGYGLKIILFEINIKDMLLSVKHITYGSLYLVRSLYLTS